MFGLDIIIALLNDSWLNSDRKLNFNVLLSRFYYFFIAEFDARAHNLSIEPNITEEYLRHIVNTVALEAKLNDVNTLALMSKAREYVLQNSVILAPIKESNSNIYMHINSVMNQCGDNADFQSNFDKSMKDLDTFITGCFSIVFSKYIQSGPFYQAVKYRKTVPLNSFYSGWSFGDKELVADAEYKLLCIPRSLKFVPYLHDYEIFNSLLYVIHPGPDQTWYVRGVPRVRDSFAVRAPIPQNLNTDLRFKDVATAVKFVHHNGHMAIVNSFEFALRLAYLLVVKE